MILFEKLLKNQAMIPKFVHFEDPEVGRICLENFDKDGDGRLSMEEAAAVSSINSMFKERTIKGFTELKYFTSLRNAREAFMRTTFGTVEVPAGMQSLSNSMFRFCNGENIIIPTSVIKIEELTFHKAKIKNLVLKGDTYIDNNKYWSVLGSKIDNLYVASHLIETYKQNNGWRLAKNILPLNEYHS